MHIQDAHVNYSGQKNLAEILKTVIEKHGISLVLVEGGWGDVSLSYFRHMATKKARIEAAEEYLKAGKIAGEEYLDIVSDRGTPLYLYGVEDKALYDENVKQFLKVDAITTDANGLISSVERSLAMLKVRAYSKELKDLEAKNRSYNDNDIDIVAYCDYLKTHTDISAYGQISELLSIKRIEDSIDFDTVNKERDRYINLLARTLDEQGSKTLLQKSVEFKAEALPASDYYAFIKKLGEDKGLAINEYPNLQRYTYYIALYNEIDHDELFRQMSALEESVTESLCANDLQRELARMTRRLELVKDFVELKLSPDDLAAYKSDKRHFKMKDWARFLNKEAKRIDLPEAFVDYTNILDKNFKTLEQFYDIAGNRDEVFFKNATQVMKERGTERAVLITGGFHTTSLMPLFKEEGYSYIVVAPAIKERTNLALYHSLLKGELSDREKAVKEKLGLLKIQAAQTRPATTGALLEDMLVNDIFFGPEALIDVRTRITELPTTAPDVLMQEDVNGRRLRADAAIIPDEGARVFRGIVGGEIIDETCDYTRPGTPRWETPSASTSTATEVSVSENRTTVLDIKLGDEHVAGSIDIVNDQVLTDTARELQTTPRNLVDNLTGGNRTGDAISVIAESGQLVVKVDDSEKGVISSESFETETETLMLDALEGAGVDRKLLYGQQTGRGSSGGLIDNTHVRIKPARSVEINVAGTTVFGYLSDHLPQDLHRDTYEELAADLHHALRAIDSTSVVRYNHTNKQIEVMMASAKANTYFHVTYSITTVSSRLNAAVAMAVRGSAQATTPTEISVSETEGQMLKVRIGDNITEGLMGGTVSLAVEELTAERLRNLMNNVVLAQAADPKDIMVLRERGSALAIIVDDNGKRERIGVIDPNSRLTDINAVIGDALIKAGMTERQVHGFQTGGMGSSGSGLTIETHKVPARLVKINTRDARPVGYVLPVDRPTDIDISHYRVFALAIQGALTQIDETATAKYMPTQGAIAIKTKAVNQPVLLHVTDTVATINRTLEAVTTFGTGRLEHRIGQIGAPAGTPSTFGEALQDHHWTSGANAATSLDASSPVETYAEGSREYVYHVVDRAVYEGQMHQARGIYNPAQDEGRPYYFFFSVYDALDAANAALLEVDDVVLVKFKAADIKESDAQGMLHGRPGSVDVKQQILKGSVKEEVSLRKGIDGKWTPIVRIASVNKTGDKLVIGFTLDHQIVWHRGENTIGELADGLNSQLTRSEGIFFIPKQGSDSELVMHHMDSIRSWQTTIIDVTTDNEARSIGVPIDEAIANSGLPNWSDDISIERVSPEERTVTIWVTGGSSITVPRNTEMLERISDYLNRIFIRRGIFFTPFDIANTLVMHRAIVSASEPERWTTTFVNMSDGPESQSRINVALSEARPIPATPQSLVSELTSDGVPWSDLGATSTTTDDEADKITDVNWDGTYLRIDFVGEQSIFAADPGELVAQWNANEAVIAVGANNMQFRYAQAIFARKDDSRYVKEALNGVLKAAAKRPARPSSNASDAATTSTAFAAPVLPQVSGVEWEENNFVITLSEVQGEITVDVILNGDFNEGSREQVAEELNAWFRSRGAETGFTSSDINLEGFTVSGNVNENTVIRASMAGLDTSRPGRYTGIMLKLERVITGSDVVQVMREINSIPAMVETGVQLTQEDMLLSALGRVHGQSAIDGLNARLRAAALRRAVDVVRINREGGAMSSTAFDIQAAPTASVQRPEIVRAANISGFVLAAQDLIDSQLTSVEAKKQAFKYLLKYARHILGKETMPGRANRIMSNTLQGRWTPKSWKAHLESKAYESLVQDLAALGVDSSDTIFEQVQEEVNRVLTEGAPSDVEDYNGALAAPALTFPQKEDLDYNQITPIEEDRLQEVWDVIQRGGEQGKTLSIEGHMRGWDVFGTSLDLPFFQWMLTKFGARKLSDFPQTLTVASEFSAKIKFEVSEQKDRIEYVAEQYEIPEGSYNPTADELDGMFKRDAQGINRLQPEDVHPMNYAAHLVFDRIFGLKGIKVTVEDIDLLPLKGGGMESSNVALVAFISAASMLSGANLSEADIFALAVKLENDELGGLTGGQGHLNAQRGGVDVHVWPSGAVGANGVMANGYGALSINVIDNDAAIEVLEESSALVQAGIDYIDGRKQIGRQASLTNELWTAGLADFDEVAYPLHLEKLQVAERGIQALRVINENAAAAKAGDEDAKAKVTKALETIVENANRHVDIRDEITKRMLNLIFKERRGQSVPDYVKQYKKQEWFKDLQDEITRLQTTHDMTLDEAEQHMLNDSLYTYGPIRELVDAARAEGIAIMPLGAGGPATTLIGISPQGQEHLQAFLESRGLRPLTNEIIQQVTDKDSFEQPGGATLKGYVPFKVGREPMQYNNFEDLGFAEPEKAKPTTFKAVRDANFQIDEVQATATSTATFTEEDMDLPVSEFDLEAFDADAFKETYDLDMQVPREGEEVVSPLQRQIINLLSLLPTAFEPAQEQKTVVHYVPKELQRGRETTWENIFDTLNRNADRASLEYAMKPINRMGELRVTGFSDPVAINRAVLDIINMLGEDATSDSAVVYLPQEVVEAMTNHNFEVLSARAAIYAYGRLEGRHIPAALLVASGDVRRAIIAEQNAEKYADLAKALHGAINPYTSVAFDPNGLFALIGDNISRLRDFIVSVYADFPEIQANLQRDLLDEQRKKIMEAVTEIAL
ncbi:MAG: hypothetical protein ABH875_02885 [Candidatus Omnitrophota bacterium]